MLVRDPSDALSVDLEGDPPKIEYTPLTYYLLLEDVSEKEGKRLPNDITQRFLEVPRQETITLDLQHGTLAGRTIYDLGAFELVDSLQWSGTTMRGLMTRQIYWNGRLSEPRELVPLPSLWDIASVDMASGERVVLIRSFCRKDALFPILNRINAVLEYARTVCAPWRDLIEADEPIPLDELREHLAENSPRFKFTPLKRRTVEDQFFVRRLELGESVPKKPKDDDDPARAFIPKPPRKDAGTELQASNTKIMTILLVVVGPVAVLMLLGVLFGPIVAELREGCDGQGYELPDETCNRYSFLPFVQEK